MSDETRPAREPSSLRGQPPADMNANPTMSYNPRDGRSRMAFPMIPSLENDIPETLPPRTGSSSGPSKDGASSDSLWRRDAVANQAEALGYTLLNVVGRGGMGEVWEAIQRSLWRRVAVKRLRYTKSGEESLSDSDTLARAFQGEALTSALLDHPNIVPVYDLGLDDFGNPLLAMKFVSGTEWSQLLAEDFGALDAETYLGKHLPILVQVCQAVCFAHAQGVVHRDLKPTQVMVGEFGEVLLMDWGLALMVGSPPKFEGQDTPAGIYPTIDTALNPAGTPGFMAPEQTSHTTEGIAPWTDVYLLGGTLFYMLTLRRPHPGKTSDEAFFAASDGIVLSFEEAAPGRHIPAEMAELAMRAMEADSRARPTAQKFLETIQDYLTGASKRRESAAITERMLTEGTERTYAGCVAAFTRLGQAQQLWPGNPEVHALSQRIGEEYARLALKAGDLTLARAQALRLDGGPVRAKLVQEIDAAQVRLLAHRRRIRQFTAAIGVLVLIVIAGGSYFTAGLRKANKRTEEQLKISERAQEAEARAKKAAVEESERATLLLADSLVAQGRNDEAVNELLRIPEGKRFWEWSFVLTRAIQDLWTSPFEYLAWSPSREIALGYQVDAGFCALRAESGEVLARLGDGIPDGLIIAFSRDEAKLAIAGRNLSTHVVDTRSWAISSVDETTSHTVTALEFSPDATKLARGNESGGVEIVDLASGETHGITPHDRPIRQLFWGKERLVSASCGTIRRSDPETGVSEVLYLSPGIEVPYRPFFVKADRDRRYFSFAFYRSPTSYGLVDGGPLHEIAVSTADMLYLRTKPWLIVASGSTSPKLIIWDLAKGSEVPWRPASPVELRDPAPSWVNPAEAGEMHVSQDESTLMYHCLGNYQFIELFSGREINSQPTPVAGARRVMLVPNGKAIWLVGDDGKTHLRPVGSPYVGARLPGNVPAFGPGDKYTAAIGLNRFEQRDAETGEIIFTGGRMYNLYRGAPTTKDDKIIFLPGTRFDVFTVEKAERATSKLLATYTWKEPPATFNIHADTSRLSFVLEDRKSVQMYSLEGPEQKELFRRDLDVEGFIQAGTFSTSGDRLILLVSTGEVVVWDATTGKRLDKFQAHKGLFTNFGYELDRTVIATSGQDQHVRLWDADTYASRGDLKYDFPVGGFTLSASGKDILAWPERGAPVIRDVSTGAEKLKLARTDFPMDSAHYIAGDTRIVASYNGAARFWDPVSGLETFNIDSGFGEISSDFKRFVYKASTFDGTLMDLAPARASDLQGGVTMSYRERLDLWMIERYRRWAKSRVRAELPESLRVLADLDGKVDGPELRTGLGIVSELARGGGFGQRGVRRIGLGTMARIWMSTSETDSVDLLLLSVDAGREEIFEFPELATTVEGTGMLLACIHEVRDFESSKDVFADTWILEARSNAMDLAARIFELRGDRERALMTARRSHAIRLIGGFHADRSMEIITRLGGELPAPPDPSLCYQVGLGDPPMVTKALAAIPPGLTAEQRTELEKAAKEKHAALRDEYLKATPPIDWDAVVAEERASPRWNPLPSSITWRELAQTLRSEIEKEIYHGRTMQEALQVESDRIDALFAWKLKGPGGGAPKIPVAQTK